MMDQSNSSNAHRAERAAFKIVGLVAVVVGALMAAFGTFWASRTFEVFSDNPFGPILEYFVPFLPIFLMLSGAYLLSHPRR